MSGDYHLHHASTLVHVPALLLERGIEPGPVFRDAGISLSTLLEPDGWFSRESAFAVAGAAERLTWDPFFGAHHGAKYRLEHLGIWGQTVVASPNLRAALKFACASVSMLESGTRIRLEPNGQKAQLHFCFDGSLGANPRQHIEGSLAVLMKIPELIGEASHVALRSSRENGRNAAELEAFFGPDLGFGFDSDYLEFDRDLLDCRISHCPDADASAHLDNIRILRNSIRTMLPYERPTLERLATLLRTSVRTIQRRLRDFGVTYEGLLDDIRYNTAANLIANGDVSVTEAAYLVGYSDVAHFSRAFRRWTGTSPREFIRRLQGPTDTQNGSG